MNQTAITSGLNFTAAAIGAMDQLQAHRFAPPQLPFETEGKVFLKKMLGLTGAEISVNSLPGRGELPFAHKHRLNEEVYLFLNGEGEFHVDEARFAVSEGSVVRVAPEGARWLKNLGPKPLVYVVIQARGGSYGEGETISDGYAAGDGGK